MGKSPKISIKSNDDIQFNELLDQETKGLHPNGAYLWEASNKKNLLDFKNRNLLNYPIITGYQTDITFLEEAYFIRENGKQFAENLLTHQLNPPYPFPEIPEDILSPLVKDSILSFVENILENILATKTSSENIHGVETEIIQGNLSLTILWISNVFIQNGAFSNPPVRIIQFYYDLQFLKPNAS